MRGQRALEDIRVLDCTTGRAGPLAAMLLADFGADVVKLASDEDADAPSYVVWSRGKRIADDIESLVASADVVVTRDAERVHASNPAAVVLDTPACLGEIPWAGGAESDALITAWFGIPLRQMSFDGGPVDSIYPVVTTLQGIWGAACAVAALFERERSGLGQTVTVAGDHGAMVGAAGALTFKTEDVVNPPPRRTGGPGGSIPFYRTYECADGEWLFFAALTPRFTQIGFEVLGLTELFEDPRLEGRGRAAMITPDHAGWVTLALAERLKTRPRDAWLGELRARGCPSGAVLDRKDWLDHPQVEAIGMKVTVDDPVLGRVEMPGVPLRFSGSSRRQDVGSARAIGNGPLDGVRVLDLGAIIAGPFAASLLGDLGADVIKVEPLTGDSFRGPGFAAYNKGQRGIALDLRRPEGKAAFLDLAATADVVIDNYRPGVLGRLGIEWEELTKTNPGIISASITGFGEGGGPFGSDAGFDPVLQAMSGMMRAQGGDSDPVFFTVPVNDVAGSATLALGCVLALFHRERTGIAQRVSTSLAAMSVLLQAEALVRYEGRPAAPLGSRDHPGPAAHQRFHRTTDGWIRIDAPNADALSALGVDVSKLGDWASKLSHADALGHLYDAGIPAVAVRTLAELAADPRVQRHEVLHRDPRPDREGFTAGRHALFSRTMRRDTLVSPRLGEHTREVLSEIGYSESEIDALVAAGATATDSR